MNRVARADGWILALLGIVLLSLGMRSATSSLTPLFRTIDAELGLGAVVLGLVGAMPPFAFAIVGLVTPALYRRFGAEGALLLAMAAVVAGQVVRAFAQESIVIVASTALTMMGIGVGNVLLPSLVKRYFAERVGLVTAVYSTLFSLGAAVPPFLAVPLADAIGWRPTLTIWAITVVLAAFPWLVLARRATVVAPALPEVGAVADTGVRLLRSPIAWALAVALWSSALVGAAGTTWLPLVLTSSAGIDDATAGIALGLLLVIPLPATLLAPLVVTRPRPAAVVLAIAGVLGTTGWIGLLVAPGLAPLLFATLAGCTGFAFPVVLVQIAVRVSTPRVAVRLSAFVQSLGYIAAGTVVLALGVVHDATDGWAVPLLVVIAIAALPLAIAPIVARPGRVDEPLGR